MEDWIIEFLIALILTTYPIWRIIKRTGLNPNYTAFIVIPIIGEFIILFYLANSEWTLNKKEVL